MVVVVLAVVPRLLALAKAKAKVTEAASGLVDGDSTRDKRREERKEATGSRELKERGERERKQKREKSASQLVE